MALLNHMDLVIRLIRKCSRADGPVLVFLMHALNASVPQGFLHSDLVSTVIDVMQTFYDREHEFKSAMRVLLKCTLSRKFKSRLETLASLLQVKCRASVLGNVDSKVAMDNLQGLEWWWARESSTIS